MAKKTKVPKSSLDHDAAIQEAIRAIEYAQTEIENFFLIDLSPEKAKGLYPAQASLSGAKSRLRDLLEAQEHRRSPSRRPGAKSAKRSDVARKLPPLPRSHPSKRRVGSRKRVSRKQAHYDRLPWYPQGYNY